MFLQRYRKARCNCIKFDAIFMRMHAEDPTGAPSDDYFIRAATAVFNAEANISNMYSLFQDKDLETGPKFEFLDALLFLRSTRQWDFVIQSKMEGPNKDQGKDWKEEVVRGSSSSTEIGPSHVNDLGEDIVPHVTPEKSVRVGSKRAHAFSSQANTLHRGADRIEQLAKAAKHRNDIAEELLYVEKQKAVTELFRLPGTNEILRNRYLQVAQSEALKRLEKMCDPANDDTIDDCSSAGLGSSSFFCTCE